ncbi:MAG TPA: hypothetical protein VGD45_01945 [Steroidobacter sp.]|uniref:hypothetical protein n=1 Tax=Steroidobacter sp. TaxID=1978227 RepID=UPI002ED92E93
MNEVATLLQAIAALLWPLFAFTALFVFRPQIADLARRLKKGKLLGQEIELDASLKRLDQSAASVEQEVAALPPPDPVARETQEEAVVEEGAVSKIVSEAGRSPKAALILLASELEKLARQLLASTGHLEGRKFVPLSQAIAELDKQFGLPKHVTSSLKHFWEARNRLIHGGEGTDADILRAVDSGLTILKALQALPREINIVFAPHTDLFSDAELRTPIPNVKGIILETHAPGGTSKTFRIFPTTQQHFVKGRQVAWEWNMQKIFGAAWYRSPDTGQPAQAWLQSAEFVGRHLDDL